MLSDAQRERVSIVLVRARNPNNIGAVARAMHNFGFTDLRLVNDYFVSLEKARSAIDASAILATAREFSSVAEAVADCSLVVGTTAVGERKREHPLLTLADSAAKLQSALTSSRVALLFGSEKTGLSNDAMSHCHSLMTIPMHPSPGQRHASMNLGQAAAICMYEVVRQNQGERDGNPLDQPQPMALAGDLERINTLLAELLTRIGYAHRRAASADPIAVRRMIYRLNLNQSDARRWIGVLRALLWKVSE
jgi:TrmH family RNA methyltransferase